MYQCVKVSSDLDTRYFDSEFTGQSVQLTPPDGFQAGLTNILVLQLHCICDIGVHVSPAGGGRGGRHQVPPVLLQQPRLGQ